jgi:hypothetical protein
MTRERARKEKKTPQAKPTAAHEPEHLGLVKAPPTLDSTPETILRLQRTIGNRAVQRLVKAGQLGSGSTIQREEGGGLHWKPSPEYRLHLDPEIEAQIRTIQFMQARLRFQNIQDAMQNLNLNLSPTSSLATPPSSVSGPPTPPPAPLVPPGKGPDTPRAGTAGDVMKAIVKIPAVEQAVNRLQTEATDQIKRDWRKLSTGEKIGIIGVSAVIGGGALIGIWSDPAARNLVLGQIQGRDYSVPGIKGLSFKFNVIGEEKSVHLTLDLMQFLPSSVR